MRTTFLLFILLTSTSALGQDRQLKEYDNDINYDEAKVPYYDLPPLLATEEGEIITTPEEWKTKRRPQILSLFSNLIYGRVPIAEFPITTTSEVIEREENYLDGKATYQKVKLEFSNKNGTVSIELQIHIPTEAEEAVPALMQLGTGGPLEKWIDRGFAVVGIRQDNFVGHNEISFEKSIHRLFFRGGQSFPKAREWGVLGAIAWGHSRVLDYLETVEAVDAERVSIMGHSKNGKAALWTAAQDERFALVISAQSGCAGAALWRRRSGETLQKMVTRFPYWLCRNAWKFVNQEDDLPVDQHMLLALIAPRPVYVASGINDTWADPRGEYASAYHASEVYRLLGKQGLTSPQFPNTDQVFLNGEVGYHCREGAHSVEDYDWEMFIKFCELHLQESE